MSTAQQLAQLEAPHHPHETIHHVFGWTLTRSGVIEVAKQLHYRGDARGGLRVLEAAGLTAHDLVESEAA